MVKHEEIDMSRSIECQAFVAHKWLFMHHGVALYFSVTKFLLPMNEPASMFDLLFLKQSNIWTLIACFGWHMKMSISLMYEFA